MFLLKEICEILKAKEPNKAKSLNIKGISTDTRTFKKGNLFIPLKGDNFDGHAFMKKAFEKGAAAALSSKKTALAKKHTVIQVNNTLKALQKIAKQHLLKFKIPVVAITGSCGKTTTKDMLASILNQKIKALKSRGNFNNEIGVPLTLLELNKSHKAAVIEMGMQRQGEIKELTQIAEPNIGIITNIGKAHLLFLENTKNIAFAKGELLAGLKPGAIAILNADDKYFKFLKKLVPKKVKIVTFGIINNADIGLKDLRGIKMPVPGNHNLYNALAAIAAAKILKIPMKLIKKGLEKFSPSGKRMEIRQTKQGITIINDTYNANPSSVAAALDTLSKMDGRKIAVLGDMLELGEQSTNLHKKTGTLAEKLGIHLLLTVGKQAGLMKGTFSFKNNPSALKKLKSIIQPGDTVLIKGSRGMHMEEIAEGLIL